MLKEDFKASINNNSDYILKNEGRLTCCNKFIHVIGLSGKQSLQRSEVLILKETLDGVPKSDHAKWGILSTSLEYNPDTQQFDKNKVETIRPLSNFTGNTNSQTLFDTRVISSQNVKFTVTLTKISESKNEAYAAVTTTFEEIKAVFGDLPSIVIKAAIW